MSLRKEAIHSFVWSYTLQFSNQIISFFVTIILARLLLPEEFGLIGMLVVFITVGNVLINGGLATSLLRSSHVTDDDYNTVFTFNLGVSIIVYILFYLIAPYISDFYNQPKLTQLARVSGLTFIIGAFSTVQNTILAKEMQFKKQTLISLPAFLLSNSTGVVLAFVGYGVWSLVWSNLINIFLSTVFIWVFSSWVPKIRFNKVKFNIHFNYGLKLTISGVIDAIFTNIYQVAIGKLFNPTLVGYYTRASSLIMLPASNISMALNKVIFPLFSKVQDDDVKLKAVYKQVMQMILFLITPITVIMGVLAEPLVVFLFTEKWIMIVPIVKILSFTCILFPIHSYNLIILQVKGQSGLFLRIELLKKALLVLILVTSIYWGFYGMLWGELVYSILALFVNAFYAGRLLNYHIFSQLKDILPSFLYSVFMGVIIYILSHYLMGHSNFLILAICGFTGIFLYILFAYLCKDVNINNIKLILKRK